ncbi:DEAD/DEAH box helicase [Microbispora sp. NEAU-D428]|uniref:DEAD/DEAH box helicase n=1 Tax=Microbispora sitophila TaxID=2771537 RepID=UPI00186734E7|nr:type ISP restriction/modification enzyme [Microbispora sitophila]MBE3010885.1 DEAD/DEAH box helicase [Microbispora sitophila]
MTIHDILRELYVSATDERDKGEKFERLIAAYLRTDVSWSDRFSNVWLWSDWPGRHGKPDTGIDLVAEERETGGLTAIQCKFYAPTHTLQKTDIDSFFTASGKEEFTARLIVSTTDKWSVHAEDALHGQQIPVTRLRVQDLDESSIDWSNFSLRTPEVMELKDKKVLRDHQRTALAKVREGFTAHDRGKLIMACGTGKTLTALRIAEDMVAPGGTVLLLVPSISLLSQTLKEWTAEAEVPLRPFAVCSDTKAGKRTDNEDISPYDLAFPATTDAGKLYARITGGDDAEKITVVFSTYQSLPVIAEAQRRGLEEFDLIICDEAHRTTGVTLAGQNESNFVRVHDQQYVMGAKRLYMTATPRIYDDNSRSQAEDGSAVLASMDDEALYGPEFHRLGFGEAVNKGLLTDYKVLVLAVDEQAVSATFQAQLADENNELRIDDAAKIVGCWNGLAKRGRAESGFGPDPSPMSRAVAFARSIEDSRKFARLFTRIVDEYVDSHDPAADDDTDDPTAQDRPLRCEADHVDGTFNVLRRSERLDWLKAPLEPDHCRILSNARCLAEGVDVPALDAVIFLNPRNSVVDVVQSVGRVMRKAPGKQYGYVILPIGIPADMTPEQALANNEKYKVVWQVLRALRAHDERFNAMINRIELNKSKTEKLQVIGVSGFEGEQGGGAPTDASKTWVQDTLSFPLDEWRDAIYAKIVKKVGDRRYWEDWAKDVSVIAERHTTRIKALLSDPSLEVAGTFERFLEGLRANLNDGIMPSDAIDMLAQHLITRPVFDALFEGYSFAEHNPVSQVMQGMLDALDEQNLDQEAETLEKFYDSVRVRAEGIDNAEGKQKIITELYEKFFKIAFPRAAESLGIVYTPVEIVDFIIRSVESVLRAEFGASLSNHGVHVLDPFTGTGTFIVRLLQSGLIRPDDLLRKYTNELHANEILLLAYYIAAINIEATYHGIAGGDYIPFNGIVLTDTFQMSEADDSMDELIFPQNNERVAHQKSLDIRVIIGNPPYSAGQTSQNDGNQNQKYPTLDASIADTYAAQSTATLKNSLYDSYIRAIRWASNRINASENGGVICYVTNGGYIDANTADGLRKSLFKEFHTIYCFNLRGNQRTAGELSRKEGGKIFGQGSRSTVAILLLVKKPEPVTNAQIFYRDIGDYLTREQKLQIIADSVLDGIQWQPIVPNPEGDWINQRNASFDGFTPIAVKTGSAPLTVFRVYSSGLKTNRDAWLYNYSRSTAEHNAHRMISFYNSQVEDFVRFCSSKGITDSRTHVDDFIDRDPLKINWNRSDLARLAQGIRYSAREDAMRVAIYRPFTKQYVYFDRDLSDAAGQIPRIFPEPDIANVGIYILAPTPRTPFSLIAVNGIPDIGMFMDAGQLFPRYVYEKMTGEADLFSDESNPEYQRIDNITDAILSDYRATYGPEISKDDIFHYIYALLHSSDYRMEFAANLRKTLPRIPKVATVEDFKAYVAAGRQLANLHIDYESVEPYPLHEALKLNNGISPEEFYRVKKMVFGKRGKSVDKTTIIYNNNVTLAGIPVEAYDYMLGSRSAIEWIMDRYQVKVDKASGIVNDPNLWSAEIADPRYIVDLLKRIVTVSMETIKTVERLPALKLME